MAIWHNLKPLTVELINKKALQEFTVTTSVKLSEANFSNGLRIQGTQNGPNNEKNPLYNFNGYMRTVWRNKVELYEGECRQGFKHGYGREILGSKEYFMGYFVEGERHGSGELFSFDGMLKLKGTWRYGEYVTEKRDRQSSRHK